MIASSNFKPLTIGILGAANIAQQFADAVQTTSAVKVTAIASRNLAKAQAFAKTHRIAQAYGNYEALLADDSIEAVYIPLPNHLHAPWAIKAAQHGKHVLCEKPLCLGLAQAKAMFAAAEQHGVMLLEAYPYWFQPHMRELLALLHSGAIGQVRALQASFGFSMVNPGYNIRMNPAAGGGALLDAGSYPVSLARVVMGEAPIRVHATPVWADHPNKGVGQGVGHGVDMAMMATLEYADHRTAHISCAMNIAYHRRAVIMGSAGSIETQYLNDTQHADSSELRLWRGLVNSAPAEQIAAAPGSGFRFAAEAFADVVRRQDHHAIARAKQASLDIAHTLQALARSARSGDPIMLHI
jgi:predicted dehydrogenase